MREDVIISYRGATYEIGRGSGFYGIWVVGAPPSQPSERWPESPEGWHGAWSRFTGIEAPGTIVAVPRRSPALGDGGSRPLVAAGLLTIGVVAGVAGLFPDYLNGSSLAHQPSNLVTHVIYLATWSASIVLIALGGTRVRLGALLGVGTGLVTFGLFFADAGTAIAGGAHLAGAGLVLALLGWLACTLGAVLAWPRGSSGAPAKPHRMQMGLVGTLTLAGLGTAAAFAPSWDSFTLRTATGVTNTLTAGNAFGSPAPVIAGNVATMVALAAVVIVAALWRPIHLGATLLAGAIIPMAAQAVAALVQLAQTVPPSQFGIPAAEAQRAGLTISPGLTPAFWIFGAFLVVLIVALVKMLVPTRARPPFDAARYETFQLGPGHAFTPPA